MEAAAKTNAVNTVVETPKQDAVLQYKATQKQTNPCTFNSSTPCGVTNDVSSWVRDRRLGLQF